EGFGERIHVAADALSMAAVAGKAGAEGVEACPTVRGEGDVGYGIEVIHEGESTRLGLLPVHDAEGFGIVQKDVAHRQIEVRRDEGDAISLTARRDRPNVGQVGAETSERLLEPPGEVIGGERVIGPRRLVPPQEPAGYTVHDLGSLLGPGGEKKRRRFPRHRRLYDHPATS